MLDAASRQPAPAQAARQAGALGAMSAVSAPQHLTSAHDVAGIECGVEELDSWLKRRALQNDATRASRTFVVTADGRVVGYYALATGAFYLCVRYRARSRRPDDDFVVRHTRMTLTGFGRFDLAYFRHTDKWFTVYRGLTAAECFQEIEGNEIFWPTT